MIIKGDKKMSKKIKIFGKIFVVLLIFLMLTPMVASKNIISNEKISNENPTYKPNPILPIRGIVMPFIKKVEIINNEEYTFYRPIRLGWVFSKIYTYSDNVEIGFKKGQLWPVIEKIGPIIIGQITDEPIVRHL